MVNLIAFQCPSTIVGVEKKKNAEAKGVCDRTQREDCSYTLIVTILKNYPVRGSTVCFGKTFHTILELDLGFDPLQVHVVHVISVLGRP